MFEVFGAPGGSIPSFIPAAGQMAMCGALCTSTGIQSVTDGTKNHDQGQQMQNMAQMAMGAMQIAMGLLGMMAGAAASGMGGKDNGNNSNLGSMGDGGIPSNYGGTSPTGSSSNPGSTTGSSGTGDGGTSGSTIGIGDLHNGAVGAALDRIEKNYGIPRDQFMQALKNGVDPKSIFAGAPKNALPMDMLTAIGDKLAEQSKDGASRALASNALNPGGASAAGTPSGDKSDTAAATPAKGTKAPTPNADDALDGEDGVHTLSPEIKAALAAKAAAAAAAAEMADVHNWNLFQLVHNRYKKLETMMYGRVERTNPNPTDATKPN